MKEATQFDIKAQLNEGTILKRVASYLLIISLTLTQTALASDCKLDLDQAQDILIQYADHHYQDLKALVAQEKLDYLSLYIKKKTFYSQTYQRYFFPLSVIRTSQVKGHVWLEVTCDEKLDLSYYLEEI